MNEANAENFFTQLEQLLDSYQQPVNTPGTVAYDFFGAIIADTDVLDHSVDDQSDLKNADQSRSEA